MIRIIFYIIGQIFKWKKQTILILLQNNNELRAGGGFITHLVKLEVGKLWFKLSFLDVFNDLKNPKKMEVPSQMQKLLRVRNLEFRDANYDPDFNKSSKTLIEIYNNLFPVEKVCLLSAANFSFIEKLWKILSPKKVDNNLFHFLSTKVSDVDLHDREELQNRKNVLKDLFKQLIKSGIFKFWKWPAIWRDITSALKSKNLQVWLDSKKLMKVLKKKKLAFEFLKGRKENFLALIDDNYLGLKTNRYLRRQIFLDQKFQEKGMVKNYLNIKLDNLGIDDYPLSGLYHSSMRIYFPKDITNLRILNKSVIFRSEVVENYKVVIIRLIISVGQSKELEIHYNENVDKIDGFKYIKQSGVENETFIHSVQAPCGVYIDDGLEHLKLSEHSVKSDLKIDYSFMDHKNSPRIYFHEIVDPKNILIKFNEPVKFKSKSRENIKVFRKDNQDENFEISDYYFKNQNRDLILKIDDLPSSEEVFYKVKLKDLKNDFGVGFTKGERSFTVVYRKRNFLLNY